MASQHAGGIEFEFPAIDSAKSEIRVLEIKPGQRESPIECKYNVVNLNDPELTYEALSYAWGSPCSHDMRTVTIDNLPAKVSPSLLNAIQQLRYVDKSRYLWIDALCINQLDDEEKTRHVNMMNQIYTKCHQCAVWLGVLGEIEPPEAEGVLEFIRWFAREGEEPAWAKDWDRGDAVANAITYFMHLPWWTRIWTVQEIILPAKATLYWGHLSIDREVLHKAADYICDNDIEPICPAGLYGHNALNHFTSSVRGLGFSRHENLLRLCVRWRFRHATDPRDKVYALMGLRQDETLPTVPSCDYTTDVRTLYKRIASDLIRNEGSLLPIIGRRGEISDLAREPGGLPSWVAHWVEPVDPKNKFMEFWIHHDFWSFGFQATADKGLRGVEDELKLIGEDVLCLYGLLVDKVAVVESPESDRSEVDPGEDFANMFRIVKRWEEVVEKFQAEWPGVLSSGWIRDLFGFAAGSFEREAPDSGYDMTDFHRDMVQDQCFFITEGGKFGLGPKCTQPGHELWVIGGSRFPFLLNRVESANDPSPDKLDFTLVADCLVHGIMSGEAVEGREEEQLEIRLH